jgi:hypothetical protein
MSPANSLRQGQVKAAAAFLQPFLLRRQHWQKQKEFPHYDITTSKKDPGESILAAAAAARALAQVRHPDDTQLCPQQQPSHPGLAAAATWLSQSLLILQGRRVVEVPNVNDGRVFQRCCKKHTLSTLLLLMPPPAEKTFPVSFLSSSSTPPGQLRRRARTVA